MGKMGDLAIGIDLGTTNCCVSIYMNNKVKIVENKLGKRVTPSFIYFEPTGGVCVGKHAKTMAPRDSSNGIYEIKRLVGRKFDDIQLQKSLQYFPFKVSSDSSNSPIISVTQNAVVVEKSPQELYTILLKELKKDAEEKFGESINKVVITVPAYFNVTQREITFAAAKKAGFTVLKLQNEPTAAALAYYYEMDLQVTHRCLVYDLGGGTFDVAILESRCDNVEVIAVAGDSQLGGQDFDACILEYICEQLKNKYGYDPALDPDDKRTLRQKSEKAKKELSILDQSVITLKGMVPQHPKIVITITRKQFEIMADKLFKKTIDILDRCLNESKFSKESIDEVILCGGSTHIPKIQEMLAIYFDGKQLNKCVNPDECVAEGAALQAAMLSTSKRQKIDRLEMVDVVPLSIGFSSMCDEMVFTIKRGSKLPTSESHLYVSSYGDSSTISAGIYEGERTDVRKNRRLATLSISNLTPAPSGQQEVIFTLSIDTNGILTAKAEDTFGENVKELKIDYTGGDRSDAEIKNTLLDAAKNRIEDEKFVEFVKYKRYLIRYCMSVVHNLETRKLVKNHKKMYKFCASTVLEAYLREMDQESEVKELIEKCKELCESVVQDHQFEFMPADI
ncbi:heat shock 70 kDa protein-like isoform X2 [Zophobas morio]|uniref:heat shock 70 kDa protein-like isoform X2 n=1 Tax=Zophobas morio TaxID=2755281 RepID=UPI0030837B4A